MNIKREIMLQERTQWFIKQLSDEFGETIYGGILVVQFKDSTASAVVMEQGSIATQKKVLDVISRAFVKVIESIKTQMNTFHKKTATPTIVELPKEIQYYNEKGELTTVVHHSVKPIEESKSFNDEDEIK